MQSMFEKIIGSNTSGYFEENARSLPLLAVPKVL